MRPDTLGIVVLAAGSAGRFGGDKLLAPFAGQPLGVHTARLAASLPAVSRIGVVPPGNDQRAALFREEGLDVVVCEDSGEGQSRSVRAGIEAIGCRVAAALILLADMPLVTRPDIDNLLEHHGAPVVLSQGQGFLSPPALLRADLFPLVRELRGDQGLSQLLTNKDDVVRVPLSTDALSDVDTPEDLAKLEARVRGAA